MYNYWCHPLTFEIAEMRITSNFVPVSITSSTGFIPLHATVESLVKGHAHDTVSIKTHTHPSYTQVKDAARQAIHVNDRFSIFLGLKLATAAGWYLERAKVIALGLKCVCAE